LHWMRTTISPSIKMLLRDNIHFVEIHICIFSGQPIRQKSLRPTRSLSAAMPTSCSKSELSSLSFCLLSSPHRLHVIS
jgi:hypothetical protein